MSHPMRAEGPSDQETLFRMIPIAALVENSTGLSEITTLRAYFNALLCLSDNALNLRILRSSFYNLRR
jgi:hypothetical protein